MTDPTNNKIASYAATDIVASSTANPDILQAEENSIPFPVYNQTQAHQTVPATSNQTSGVTLPRHPKPGKSQDVITHLPEDVRYLLHRHFRKHTQTDPTVFKASSSIVKPGHPSDKPVILLPATIRRAPQALKNKRLGAVIRIRIKPLKPSVTESTSSASPGILKNSGASTSITEPHTTPLS